MQKIHYQILIYPLSIIAVIILNILLSIIIIPDECYYHTHGTNFVFDFFFDTSSASNGHPEPTLFNLIFTFVLGLYLGKRGVAFFYEEDNA